MCALSFSTTAATQSEVVASSPSLPVIDITDLINKSGIDADELATLGLCPAFDFYRSQLGLGDMEAVDLLSAAESVPLQAISYSWTSSQTSSSSSRMAMKMGMGVDNSSGDIIANHHLSDIPPTSTASPMKEGIDNNEPSVSGNDWIGDDGGEDDGDYGHQEQDNCMDYGAPDESNGPPIPAGQSSAETVRQSLVGADMPLSGSDAQMIGTAFTKDNEWAGAKHWKYGHRKAADPVAKPVVLSLEEDAAATSTTTKAKHKSTKRKKDSATTTNTIVFTMEYVDEALFEMALDTAKGGDANSLREANREKAAKINESALLLPADAMLHPKDLCRLFLTPQLLVPPPPQVMAEAQLLLNNVGFVPAYADLVAEDGKDKIFGRAVMGSNVFATNFSSLAAGNNGFGDRDDDMFGGGDEYDDGDDFAGNDADNVDSLAEDLGGLAINQSNLLQANRVVEKVKIGYGNSCNK